MATKTLLNLPPSTPSNNDTSSDPGTPASGISTLSTTAIKDGHEGHHLHASLDIAADRVARLGGIGSPTQSSSFQGVPPSKDYFEREGQFVPHTPGTGSIVSSVTDDHTSTPEGETYGPNSTQAKRENMAAAIARRQHEQQQQQQQGVPTQAQANFTSNNTTPSAAEARLDAKFIDGMTYDDGDTTAEGLGRRDTIRPGQIPPGLNNAFAREENDA